MWVVPLNIEFPHGHSCLGPQSQPGTLVKWMTVSSILPCSCLSCHLLSWWIKNRKRGGQLSSFEHTCAVRKMCCPVWTKNPNHVICWSWVTSEKGLSLWRWLCCRNPWESWADHLSKPSSPRPCEGGPCGHLDLLLLYRVHRSLHDYGRLLFPKRKR